MLQIQKLARWLYQNIVTILFAASMLWLVLLAGFGTVVIDLDSERNWFVPDSMLLSLLTAAAAGMAALLLSRCARLQALRQRINSEDALFRRLRGFLLLLTGLTALVLVVSLQVIPSADQSMILETASLLNSGDISRLQPGGYLQGRHNQYGIVFLLQLYVRLFGDDNYLAFQVGNVLALIVIYYELSLIGGLTGLRRFGQLLICAFGVLFLPMQLYCTFLYGTVQGLAFALAAIRHAVLCARSARAERGGHADRPDRLNHPNHPNRSNRSKHACVAVSGAVRRPDAWRHGLLSALYICIACLLKNNYVIFLIAIVLYLTVRAVSDRTPCLIITVLLTAALMMVSNFSLSLYFNSLLGEPVADGMSLWSYIAMGLQECSYGTDGWYNGYNNNSFTESGYDSAVQAQMALASIAERLQVFLSDKTYALRYFSRKIASEWNNPLFQSDWIITSRESGILPPAWTSFLTNAVKRDRLIRIYNILQFLFLFGCLLFPIAGTKMPYAESQSAGETDTTGGEEKISGAEKTSGSGAAKKAGWRVSPQALLLESLFLGGFLFHLIWEAKAQYTVCFYITLLPLSVMGWRALPAWMESVAGALRRRILRKSPCLSCCCMRHTPRGADQTFELSGRDGGTSRRLTLFLAAFLVLCLITGLSDGKISTNVVRIVESDSATGYEEFLAAGGVTAEDAEE